MAEGDQGRLSTTPDINTFEGALLEPPGSVFYTDLPSILHTTPTPSLQINLMQTAETMIFWAALQNAIFLGLDIGQLRACPTGFYMSPFYRPGATAQDDPGRLVSAALSRAVVNAATVPQDLHPTLAQVLIPHHAALDLIPLPRFRDRVIMLSAALPHVFNLAELKLDIYARGALAFAALGGAGDTQPWDSRNWRAAPWFLSKWNMAVDSDSTELGWRQRGNGCPTR